MTSYHSPGGPTCTFCGLSMARVEHPVWSPESAPNAGDREPFCSERCLEDEARSRR